MTSTIYCFDENEFILEFKRYYYNESNFDLNAVFNEYFQNFIKTNSDEYNLCLIIKFYSSDIINYSTDISLLEYIYIKLFEIISKTIIN
jgi:hypothetical protein